MPCFEQQLIDKHLFVATLEVVAGRKTHACKSVAKSKHCHGSYEYVK